MQIAVYGVFLGTTYLHSRADGSHQSSSSFRTVASDDSRCFDERPGQPMSHAEERGMRHTTKIYSHSIFMRHYRQTYDFFDSLPPTLAQSDSDDTKKRRCEERKGKERKIEDFGVFAPDFSSLLNLLLSVLGQCSKAKCLHT